MIEILKTVQNYIIILLLLIAIIILPKVLNRLMRPELKFGLHEQKPFAPLGYTIGYIGR